jgi:D-apiose dehydrogenase
MSKLRGGLFGCGMISEFHLRGWQRIPEVEIVALGNRTIQRAEERRAQFAPQAQVYDDLQAMLDEAQLDFIDILTPPALHREHCLQAQAANVHIICQKPLCDNLADAQALVAAMQDYSKLFAVHENHRYRPWFQEVLRLQQEGFFGQLQFVRLEHLNPTAPNEIYKLQTEAGVLLEYGTHLVDMMRALLGEPWRVQANLHRVHPAVKGESLAHVIYDYAQTTAVVNVAWKSQGALQGNFLLIGEHGEAYYEGTMTRGEMARFRVFQQGALIRDEERSPTDDYKESFYIFQRACIDAILNGTAAPQTGAENLKTLSCTWAAYQSAAQKMQISCQET